MPTTSTRDFLERLVAPLDRPEVRGTFPTPIEWLNPSDGLAPGWLHVRSGAPDSSPEPYGERAPYVKALRRRDFEQLGGYPRVGHGEDQVFGREAGPAVVVRDARWWVSLPSRPREVFLKARWIGRGVRFDRERPPLWTMLPPPCCPRSAAGAGALPHRPGTDPLRRRLAARLHGQAAGAIPTRGP